jgi:hypothetical protein
MYQASSTPKDRDKSPQKRILVLDRRLFSIIPLCVAVEDSSRLRRYGGDELAFRDALDQWLDKHREESAALLHEVGLLPDGREFTLRECSMFLRN